MHVQYVQRVAMGFMSLILNKTMNRPKIIPKKLPLHEAIHIVEIFNSTHEIGPRREETPHPELSKYGDAISDSHSHLLDGGSAGIMSAFKRNGAYEIHHRIDTADGVRSGVINSSHDGQPNPKFIGTMMAKAKEFLDAGHSVRIVGNKDAKNASGKSMFDNYRKIGAIIAKQWGYGISPAEPYTLKHPHAKFYDEFVIHPKLNEAGPIGMLWQMTTNNACSYNDYDVGYISSQS